MKETSREIMLQCIFKGYCHLYSNREEKVDIAKYTIDACDKFEKHLNTKVAKITATKEVKKSLSDKKEPVTPEKVKEEFNAEEVKVKCADCDTELNQKAISYSAKFDKVLDNKNLCYECQKPYWKEHNKSKKK